MTYQKSGPPSYMGVDMLSFKEYIYYILKFDDFFLQNKDNECHVYVFNIVFGLGFDFSEYINTKINSDYLQCVIKYYNYILSLLSKQKTKDSYSFPKWFIVKHDNMDLDKDIKTIHGETLGSHPLIN